MFDIQIKCAAVKAAVLMFFVMGIVCLLFGHSPATSAARCILGSLAVYFVVRIAGQIVVRVMIAAMVEEQIRRKSEKETF